VLLVNYRTEYSHGWGGKTTCIASVLAAEQSAFSPRRD
jgi:hypothetical protein